MRERSGREALQAAVVRRGGWWIALLCILMAGWPAPTQAAQPPLGRTLILAAQDDPYYSLAEEISREEGLEIVGSFDDARARSPEFLLWVVAPARLSERVFVDLGLAARASRSSIAIGIISGTTLEQARQLWTRRTDVRGERVFAANGEYPAARVFQGRILSFSPAGTRVLTRESLRGVLQEADYLTFTGHGGPGYLSLAPGNAMRARDIPPLPPVVVGTASCQTFQLWRPGSIALAFPDQGAAAYAGFAFSPNEGFLMGEFDGLPFRYTWPEFPIGHVMLVQARGTQRGFAAFSYYYLLGDPRISLRRAPAYRVAEDREVGNDRLVTIADAPAGVLPIRISGGARYRFAEISGFASAGDDDPFYDARLQTANVGDAKYLLFKHAGGGFTVRLRRDVPAPRAIVDPLLDSLDNALIFLYQNESRYFALVVGLVVWLGVGWRMWRRKAARVGQSGSRALLIALAVGLALAALHGAYG